MQQEQKLPRSALFVFVAFMAAFSVQAQEPSVCYGTTSNGSLKNGWKLPAEGSNFSSYSTFGRLFGRTYVHGKVHDAVLQAYASLEAAMPGTVFVYGETGLKEGGRFEPHKTHQNGLSVDFMVPVLDKHNESVPLPTSMINKWGYDLEFDESGALGDLRIDYEAIAEHLYQLHIAAKKHEIGIWRVIFDPKLRPNLHDAERWSYLADNVEFSTTGSWVRHDEHYHVDFNVDCEPAT